MSEIADWIRGIDGAGSRRAGREVAWSTGRALRALTVVEAAPLVPGDPERIAAREEVARGALQPLGEPSAGCVPVARDHASRLIDAAGLR
jgi:hypothetical protein